MYPMSLTPATPANVSKNPFEYDATVAPVHGWFTEGLDMADVKDAGLLLAQLA